MLAASYQYPILDFFLTMLYFFLFVIWIWLLITVFVDIFRSHDMGGVAKALWVIFVTSSCPSSGVFVYLIARGGKMHERAAEAAQAAEGVRRAVATSGRDAREQHRRSAVEAGRPQVAGRPHRRRVRGAEVEDPCQLSSGPPRPLLGSGLGAHQRSRRRERLCRTTPGALPATIR